MKKILWLFSLIFLLFTSSAFSAVLYKTESLNHRIDVYGDYTSKGKTFAQLISSINASTLQSFDLIINSTVNITADVTIPSKVKNIYFNNNGVFYSASTTYNITFTNSTYIETKKQAFAGKINTLGVFANSKIYPWYWQATKNDATDDATGFTQFLNMVSGNSQITGVIDGTYYLISNVAGIGSSSNIIGEGSSGKIYTNGIEISGSTINIQNIEFVKYSTGTSIFNCFTKARYNITISGCTFRNGNQTIYIGQNVYHYNWKIINNKFFNCTYGLFIETAKYLDISYNQFYNCVRAIQRMNTHHINIENNYIDGMSSGVVGILQLPSATQFTLSEGFGFDVIQNNVVINHSDEAISYDIYGNDIYTTVRDYDTIVSTTSTTITLSNTGWAGAGNRYANWHAIVVSGNNTGKLFKIKSQSDSILTLDIYSDDMKMFRVGDGIVIAQPFICNKILNNYVEGKSNGTSETGISLYGLNYNTIVKNNTSQNFSKRGLNLTNIFGVSSAGAYLTFPKDLYAPNNNNLRQDNIFISANVEYINLLRLE